MSTSSGLCPNCLISLRNNPVTADEYAVYAEAALFAYLQRDELKIARRLEMVRALLEKHPDHLCPVHLRSHPL